jgi:hypothetical protein
MTPKGNPYLFGLDVAMRRILCARLHGNTRNGDARRAGLFRAL